MLNKSEFLSKLERLLWNIPKEEREEAIQYYEEYFNDAGVEKEAELIAELESPEKVAKSIRDGFLNGTIDSMEYTERGVHNGNTRNNNMLSSERGTEQSNSYTYGGATAGQATDKKAFETWQIVLIVAAVVLLSPVWLTILAGVGGAILGVIGAILGILIAAIACIPAFAIAGVLCVGIGISQMAISPALGFIVLGIGLLFLGGMCICLLVTVLLIGKAIPGIVKGIKHLCTKKK